MSDFGQLAVCQQVDGRKNEPALSHLSLKDQCKPTVVDKIVHTLYNRVHWWQAVEHHHPTALHQIPPLPVAVHVGGEIAQGGMLWIAQQSHGTCLLGEVDRTPEDGQEFSLQPLDRSGLGREEYFFPFFQRAESLTDVSGDEKMPVLGHFHFRIHPYIPAVSPWGILNGDKQFEPLGLFHPVESHIHLAAGAFGIYITRLVGQLPAYFSLFGRF